MSEDEYNFPIFLDGERLSQSFHWVSSLISFDNRLFRNFLLPTALDFHYASITPKQVPSWRVRLLADRIDNLLKNKLFGRWSSEVLREFDSRKIDLLHKNFRADIDILRVKANSSNSNKCFVYRIDVPQGISRKAGESLEGIGRYLKMQNGK